MKLSKEYLQGYADCAIKLSDFDTDLNVRAKVYFIDLTQDFQVELHWNTGYDNALDEEVAESAKFSIKDHSYLPYFEKFETDFIKKLDDISKETYDADYDSRQAEAEFREEQKFEYNRGN